VLQALAADARRDRRNEAVDLLDRQPPENAGIRVVAEEGEQLGDHRRVVRHRRLGEPPHLVEMVAVLPNEELAAGRRQRGEHATLVEEQRKRANHGGEVHVVLRIARSEGEQLGARETLQPANAASAQARVDAWHSLDSETDRQAGVSRCVQPDREVLDERTQERQRGEAGVETWIEIGEHDGLRKGKAARLQVQLCGVDQPEKPPSPTTTTCATPHNQVLHMSRLMWSCT